MYRTLSELRQSVDRLIAEQGANAPCASFIFTQEDVFYYPKNEDGFPDLDNPTNLNADDTDEVLVDVGGCDWIYEQILEVIEDSVKSQVRKSASV